MLLLKYIKMARQMMREQAQVERDLKRLVRKDLDYACLQRLIDGVSLKNVEMEVKMADKTIYIRPTGKTATTSSFYDKYRLAQGMM